MSGSQSASPAPIRSPARKRDVGKVVLAAVGIPIASIGVVLVAVLWVGGLGAGTAAAGSALALVPLAIVVGAAIWVDRWEREPRWAIAFAILWGAGFAALIGVFVGVDGGTSPLGEFFATVIQSPIIEELAKGLAILILVWTARRQIDGPIDGIVYAMWTAAGFAFVENILYFGQEILEDGNVGQVFLLRGIMSPFAHVMFTACTGLVTGWGLTLARSGWGRLGYWLLGLIPAMLLHGLWNGAATLVPDFFGYYFLVQVPLFAIGASIVLWLRRAQRRRLLARAALDALPPPGSPA